jgi:myotubularin-related protein 1/2
MPFHDIAPSSSSSSSSSSSTVAPPKSFSALGAAGHTVVTADCFQRYNGTRSASLGRGLYKATSHVGSAFWKGTSTLINKTVDGTANGGVFGFAKGLGLGMWGFGSHTVKGAFRSVGSITNVVGEMMLGMDPHFSLDGFVILTNYRIVWTSTAGDTLDVPLASLLTIETAVTAPHVLLVDCKHLMRPQFAFENEDVCQEFINATLALYAEENRGFSTVHFDVIMKTTNALLFAQEQQEKTRDNFYNAHADYTRLGLTGEKWMYVENAEYVRFPTYPSTFVVPKGLTESDLDELRSYRSASRIPAVVWLHPLTQATLCRCAQPCAGLSGFTADGDKKLVALLQMNNNNNSNSNNSSSSSTGVFHFFDARSQIAAAGNFAQGKGTEDIRNYPHTMLHHCDIANIHGVRSSYMSLASICQPNAPLDIMSLQRTLWLSHCSSILTAAQHIAAILCTGESVMVHCSDGWDRTSQLAGLVEIVLDPYYRTLQGFLELIDKEWYDTYAHIYI